MMAYSSCIEPYFHRKRELFSLFEKQNRVKCLKLLKKFLISFKNSAQRGQFCLFFSSL